LILSAFGCTNGDASAPRTGDKKGTSDASEPRKVRVVAAQNRLVTGSISATGSLAAQDQVALALKVTGRIAELNVDLGDRVKKGRVIARLDTSELQLGVDQAAAALQQARTRLGLPAEGSEDRVNVQRAPLVRQAAATLNEAKLGNARAQQLFDQKLIARSELDAAVAAYQVAEGRYQDAIEEIRNRQAILAQRRTELALARQRLADATLVAPIDGAISDRPASVGQYLSAGSPVVTIVRMHPLRLRLPIPERAASGVHVGQKVKITVDEDTRTYYGKVARLSPAIDETNRTLMVEAEVPNEQNALRPGTFCRAELITASNVPSVFVPATALIVFAGLEKVLVVENGKAVEKLVKTGRKDGVEIEIIEGLHPGEQVIDRPGNLVGGQSVVAGQTR
jgi:RND family efflux transporter MFP subunit